MKTLCIAAIVAVSITIAGCGGGTGTSELAGATRASLDLTPAGSGDFILVGETGIYVNTAPAAVQTPTLVSFTRFPTSVGLAAPVPPGFGFVAAADIEPVDSGRDPVALAAPVILRIPVTRSLPEGRKLVIMIADDTDRAPVFRPLTTSTGLPVQATVRSDGMAEFSTTRFGKLLLASQE